MASYYQSPGIQSRYETQSDINATNPPDNTPSGPGGANVDTGNQPGSGGDIPYVYPSSSTSSRSESSSWSGLPGWSKGFAKDWLSEMAWAPGAFRQAYNQYATEPRNIIQDMAANTGQRLLAQQPAINDYMRPAIEDASRRGIGGGSLAQAMQTAMGQDLLRNYWSQYAQGQNAADQMMVEYLADLARMGYTGAAAIPAGLSTTRESRSKGLSTSQSSYSNPLAYYQLMLGLT